MSNQIKLTIDISDELLSKVMTVRESFVRCTTPVRRWYTHDQTSSNSTCLADIGYFTIDYKDPVRQAPRILQIKLAM